MQIHSKLSHSFFLYLWIIAGTFSYGVQNTSNIVIISIDDIIVPIVLDVTPIQQPTTQQAYLNAINQARSQTQDCGYKGIKPPVPALAWNTKLYEAAQIHSNDLAQSNTFDHTGSGTSTDIVAQAQHPGAGSTPSERIEYEGYLWSSYGENIAAGQSTLSSVITAWLNSPGHCANIMSPNFTEVGMAKVTNANSTYKIYWTQDFGKPQ